MASRKGRITLGRIDQGLQLLYRRTAPAFLSAHLLGRTAFVGATPHVMFPVGFLLPDQSRLIVFYRGAVHHQRESAIAWCGMTPIRKGPEQDEHHTRERQSRKRMHSLLHG